MYSTNFTIHIMLSTFCTVNFPVFSTQNMPKNEMKKEKKKVKMEKCLSFN